MCWAFTSPRCGAMLTSSMISTLGYIYIYILCCVVLYVCVHSPSLLPQIAQRLSLPRGHWNRSSFPSALRNLNDYTCTAHSLAHSSESVEETLLKVLWSPDGTREPWAIDDEADDEEKEEEELGHAAAAVALDRAKSGASSVAGQGIRGVRCRWGRVQEPSFLLRLEEV